MCRHVLEAIGPGGSIAFLLARLGVHVPSGAELAWASVITEGLAGAGLASWPVYFADDAVVRVFAPDDLLAAG